MSTLEPMAAPGIGKDDKMETGLQSPPETNMKDTSSDSELSDLEPELTKEEELKDDELTDLQPDHYSPDSTVPVFKPTMEEFKDFQRYMRGIHDYGMRHGIVKVIPPAEWLANQPRLDDIVKTIRIKEPIAQEIMGSNGTYRQANILHGRSYNLPQWRQLCDQSEHQPPAKRGERRANADKITKPLPRTRAAVPARESTPKKKAAARSAKGKGKASVLQSIEAGETLERPPTPETPTIKTTEKKVRIKKEHLGDDECADKPKGGRQPKAISVSSRRKNSRREGSAAIDEEAFKDFNYELEGVDYSQERCDELERSYWKSLTYAPPLYGADMMGSLFDERTTTWNLGKLENILDVLGSKIPGVNTAYLYLGMWKATFAWHLEDVDLYSINYLHFGAPKQWYSISQGDARRFEAAMKTIWPADAKACDQFLRHKTFLISPSRLMDNFNIKVNKIVHHPGEFVITFPYGYHSGYNLGYNCAEAVNFGLDAWLPFGRVAKKCDCSEAQDSVWIDVSAIDRKLRGEETDYDESDEDEDEEDEDDLETSIAPVGRMGGLKIKAPQKKRKRSKNEKHDHVPAKKIRVRIKLSTKEPCMLCPNDIPAEELLLTEDGRKAHRICALYIPETSITEGKTATITDVKYIDKARMELKCNYCRSKKGACFQCSQKKCTRAYHATCAAAAGVLVEQGETPVFGEDGTEYKDWGIEFSCRFHRTKRDHKKWDNETLDNNERTLKAASLLKVGETCQMQYYRSEIFAGIVVENRQSEEMLLLDILPRGERIEVQYKWLLVPDAADFRLTKPSANAIPMPKSFKDKESLNTTKRMEGDLPRKDDIFVEGCVWSEFITESLPRNPAQVKVDFSKLDQIWYYLGKTSTEAKAQFTESLSRPRHNPRGHFLDTIPKAAPSIVRQSFSASYPSAAQASQTIRPPIRPPMPPSNNSANKSDKPYVYKPRVPNYGEANYSVDPQAYRSQQSFVQQSQQGKPQFPPQYQNPTSRQPYNFGTDPRWQTPDIRSPSPYANQTSVPLWNGKPGPNDYRSSDPQAAKIQGAEPVMSTASLATPIRPPPAQYSQSTSFHSDTPTAYPSQPSVAPSSSAFPSHQSQPSASHVPHPPKSKGQAGSTQKGISYLPPSRPTPSATPLNNSQHQYRPPILPPKYQANVSSAGGALKYQPPSQTPANSLKYQPAYQPTQPQKAGNPFSGRTPATAKPNVFAKYPYLQKEHNRSPLEYKSPYRPNGGFMNGYQGNVHEHMKQTLFHGKVGAGVGSGQTNALSPYNGAMTSTSTHHSQSSPVNGAGTTLVYVAGHGVDASSTDSACQSLDESQISYQTSQSAKTAYQSLNGQETSWDRKDTSQLHPAIRQDYGSILPPQQAVAARPLSSHSNTQVAQAPVAHNASQSAQIRSTSKHEYRPVNSSLSAAHPQSYNKASSVRQGGHPQHAGTVRQSFHPQNATPPPPRKISTPKRAPVQNLPPTATFKIAPPAMPGKVSASNKELLHERNETAQQYSDNVKSQPLETSTKTFTDVPVDSTSILERLFQNLRKVGESQARGLESKAFLVTRDARRI